MKWCLEASQIKMVSGESSRNPPLPKLPPKLPSRVLPHSCCRQPVTTCSQTCSIQHQTEPASPQSLRPVKPNLPCFHQNKAKPKPPILPQVIEFKLFTEEAKDFLISRFKKNASYALPQAASPGGQGPCGCLTGSPADLQFNSLLCTIPDTV